MLQKNKSKTFHSAIKRSKQSTQKALPDITQKFKQIFFSVVIPGTKFISKFKLILLQALGYTISYSLTLHPPGKYFPIAVSQLLECLEFTSCITYIDF